MTKKKNGQSLFGDSDVAQEAAELKNDNGRAIQLSPSTLALFKDCPRCFWLQMKKGVYRPRGIFPSLPGGMDSVIKTYFDTFRGTKAGLPPELRDKVEGRLLSDQLLLNKWRARTGGLRYADKKTGAKLIGLLDDCLVVDEGGPSTPPSGRRSGREEHYYVPLDYKTRGWAPKDDTSNFYEHQIDIYEWLLQENGYKTKGLGYLVYYHPIAVREHGVVQFEITPKRMASDPARGKKLFDAAAALLQSGAAAKPSANCEFCPWGREASLYDHA